jgi:hypothetical protein
VAVREPTPEKFTVPPRRSNRRGTGGGDPLTTVVFDLSMAVGELKNAVGALSSQGETQTRELREIRDIVTGFKAIAWFIAVVVAALGLLKFWPAIHKLLA